MLLKATCLLYSQTKCKAPKQFKKGKREEEKNRLNKQKRRQSANDHDAALLNRNLWLLALIVKNEGKNDVAGSSTQCKIANTTCDATAISANHAYGSRVHWLWSLANLIAFEVTQLQAGK